MRSMELLDNGMEDSLVTLDLAIIVWLWYWQQEPKELNVLVLNLKSCAQGNYL